MVAETTALGAAYAAGLATGFWNNQEDLRENWAEDKRWEPQMDAETRKRNMHYLEEGGHADLRLGRVTAVRCLRWGRLACSPPPAGVGPLAPPQRSGCSARAAWSPSPPRCW